MKTLDRDDILSVKEQKQDEDNYLESKDPKPELKLMSIDIQSAPTCLDKAQVILGSMQGCTGIPLIYVI